MNVTRTFLHEGKTLQEIMEILLPIYIQEKTCNINEEELEFTQQKILKLSSKTRRKGWKQMNLDTSILESKTYKVRTLFKTFKR